jgi:mono/diheme cytochrome c family protein
MVRKVLAAVAIFAAASGGAALLDAQRGQADPLMRIWTGVYAPTQAERGKAAFSGSCASCHSSDLAGGSGPQLAGLKFMTKWELESLNHLFRQIKDTMPRNSPGTLEDNTVLDLMAFILQSNGFPAASTTRSGLPTDEETLDGIVLVPKSGPTKVPNFALVQLGGCLTGSGGRGWMLTHATEPTSTKDTAPTGADLKSVAGVRGAGQFQLVSVLPFAPERYKGQAVYVKGIINRSPSTPLLNVTALAPNGGSCAD